MTEQEFLDFWKTIKWPEPRPIFYRLYHDHNGWPLFYSREDLAGKYIDITPEQFIVRDMSVRVINGKLVPRKTVWLSKLVPAASGTLCHHKDVAVVVSNQSGQHWKKKENVTETD